MTKTLDKLPPPFGSEALQNAISAAQGIAVGTGAPHQKVYNYLEELNKLALAAMLQTLISEVRRTNDILVKIHKDKRYTEGVK